MSVKTSRLLTHIVKNDQGVYSLEWQAANGSVFDPDYVLSLYGLTASTATAVALIEYDTVTGWPARPSVARVIWVSTVANNADPTSLPAFTDMDVWELVP
jgi:hypothetical protein